jgi:hypothetical protein
LSRSSANHWKAHEAYSPDVEVDTVDLVSDAVAKVYAALTDAGIDVLSVHGPR